VRSARMWKFFGEGAERFKRQGLEHYAKHPERPVQIWSLPPMINESFRAIGGYDPRFGDAFYTGTWDENFDHEATLRALDVPAVLIHANWKYDDDGILMAAMDDEDARRARELMSDVEFIRVDSGHGFHWEKPGEFAQILYDLKERCSLPEPR